MLFKFAKAKEVLNGGQETLHSHLPVNVIEQISEQPSVVGCGCG